MASISYGLALSDLSPKILLDTLTIKKGDGTESTGNKISGGNTRRREHQQPSRIGRGDGKHDK
jgi:hypothetical protein